MAEAEEFHTPPAPAATVLLLRDEPVFEVLMIERHENSAFAGGALVFPGGRVDPGDRLAEWAELADGLSDDPVFAAAEVAAIREAFEEVGVLLARDEKGEPIGADRVQSLNSHRQLVEKDDSLFLELIRRENLRLACDALTLFAHWIAPPGLHRRFDTHFFAASFPDGQRVLEDGNEATEAVWIEPAAALAARKAGRRKIIFPTACNLGLLTCSPNVGEAISWAREREIRPITPAAEKRGGKIILQIPDGLGYPVTEEPLDLARPDLSRS
ncbi:MAG: NUDIX domain-containing protein [Parvularculaceae bacterium]|nr:NUDIX domain-containing protein [Parvularculaceae bacterium]